MHAQFVFHDAERLERKYAINKAGSKGNWKVHYNKIAIIKCFENGGFVVSLNGNAGQSVALDEVHKISINKDLKHAITRQTQAYLQKMSVYLRPA